LSQCQYKVTGWGIMFICDIVLPWLVFTLLGLEQDWLSQCQYKVTGWSNMFICDMVLQCQYKVTG